MPQDILTPQEAEKLASKMREQVRAAISALSGMEELADKLHVFADDCWTGELPPKWDLIDFPGRTGIDIACDGEGAEFLILCRGVDITIHCSREVVEDAARHVAKWGVCPNPRPPYQMPWDRVLTTAA